MRINFQFKFLIVLILVLLFMNIFMPFITMAVDEEFYDPREFDDGDYNTLSDTTIGNKNLSIKSVLTRFFSLALNIVRIISLSWAILMAFAIAIKYITGSTGIKAQIKSDMPTYVIGAVLLFGAYGLITLIKNLVDYIAS